MNEYNTKCVCDFQSKQLPQIVTLFWSQNTEQIRNLGLKDLKTYDKHGSSAIVAVLQ